MAVQRTSYKEWVTEENLVLIKGWARDGCTDYMIAERIGVTNSTFSLWKSNHEEIREAVKEGREVVDYRVENALLKRALGYKVTEIKTVLSALPNKDGSNIQRIERLEREVPPDTTAIAIWLNNRKPDQWKRNRDNFVSLSDDESKITVNIIREGKQEEVKKPEKEKKAHALMSDDDEWPEDDDEWAEFEDEEEWEE